MRYKRKVMFGEISLKLCQTIWNVARINVVVVDELPSQISFYICLTIDIWTQWRRRTINAVLCASVLSTQNDMFQINWRQKLSTLLWRPLTRRKALSENYTMHTILC